MYLKGKVFGYVLMVYVLLIVAFGLYGMFSNFLLSKRANSDLDSIHLILSLLFLSLFFVSIFVGRRAAWFENIRIYRTSWVTISLVGLFFGPFLLWIGLIEGAAFFAQFVSNSPSYIIVEARNISIKTRNYRCINNYMELTHPDYISEVVCAKNRARWPKVADGGKLKLVGEKSYFGFKYREIKDFE